MEQFVRDARIAMIYEGANGIQALDLVGRKLPQGRRPRDDGLLRRGRRFVKEHGEDAALGPSSRRSRQALDDLQQATMWFMQNAMAKPDNAGAGATDYMHLFGLVALGYMWARIAKAAQAEARASGAASAWTAKLVTGRFFMERDAAGDRDAGSRGSRPARTTMMALPARGVLTGARTCKAGVTCRVRDDGRLYDGRERHARSLHLRSRPHAARPRQAGRRAARGDGLAPRRHGAARACKDRNDLDTALVDDVILGCVDPVGEAGGDIARAAALAAGYGNHVPGVQINRFCASGLDAVNFAAAQVMAGQHDMAVGGGVESMSRVGIGASGGAWPVDPAIAIKSYFMPQGVSADLIATKYGFTRDDCDAYAVRVAEARRQSPGTKGRFADSVVPVRDVTASRCSTATSTCGPAPTCSRSAR